MRIIATSDWHLHQNRPPMRTDEDWLATQQKCLDSLAAYAHINNMPIFVAGDVFDTPTVSSAVLNMTMRFVLAVQENTGITYISGNHDQPYHQYERIDESSYGVLDKIQKVVKGPITYGMVDYGLNNKDLSGYWLDIVMLHTFAVREEKDKPPMRESVCAEELLEQYPKAHIILVGDNHEPWSYKKGDRLVVNCGSLLKRNVKDLEHPTGFWVVDTIERTAEHVSPFTVYERDFIDTSYTQVEEDRGLSQRKYADLVEQLKDGIVTSYDFISTLERYVADNAKLLGNDVADFLNEVIEHVKEAV